MLLSCNEEKASYLFQDLTLEAGVTFENNLSYTEDFNPYIYRNFYNGAGVALADINNDGLLDIYLTGNQVDNKLFLNKGNWQFEDITETAGVSCPGVWSSGATFVDINADGWMDFYVCKSGKPEGDNRYNELFINNQDNTFSEQAERYNLDIEGLSTHSAFFDYDKDGDLDAYILTNSARPVGVSFDLIENQRQIPDPNNEGNKLLRNDNGVFTDITLDAGIYSSAIGFGLGITLGDFNQDSWTDIFISNDFFERDYLYINDQNGGFEDQAEAYFQSLSMGSMGADVGDLNNDGKLALMVTEMLPRTIERRRSKTIFESWNKYSLNVSKGYHHQFSRNALQRNTGDGGFLEISRFADVAATEWSWGSLLFDMNNDGLRDIFVANGIAKDLLDRDYLNFMANPDEVREMIRQRQNAIESLLSKIPSAPVPNTAFINQGDFIFKEQAEALGLGKPTFSNGSAYGDLDNDGDLDLVINNINMPSQIFRNNTNNDLNRSLRILLRGEGKNTSALGATIQAWAGDQYFYSENFTARGFQSSVDPIQHIGVGNINILDSLMVFWPVEGYTVKYDVPTNELITIYEKNKNLDNTVISRPGKSVLTKLDIPPIHHRENSFSDFDREPLLAQMCSNEGPDLSSADIDGDADIDFFIGGAKGDPAKIILSQDGNYQIVDGAFLEEFQSEDVTSTFFDCDNDGDMDLFVGSGGRAFSAASDLLQDRLYINDGQGNLNHDKNRLPPAQYHSTSCVDWSDFDDDGDLDLFVGRRFHPFYYGRDGGGKILMNDGNGHFEDVTQRLVPALTNIGMVTDARWVDLDGQAPEELVIVGEWMGIEVFKYQDSKLKNITDQYFDEDLTGWWNCLETADVDNDADLDITAGNHGLNSFMKSGLRMYMADFDRNGSVEHIICEKRGDRYYPIADKDELTKQIPGLNKDFFYYRDFAKAAIDDLFSPEILDKARIWEANVLETSLFINEGQSFRKVTLPYEAQYSGIYAIKGYDINDDGYVDLVLGGNQYNVKPQFGRYDGLNGLLLYGSPSGFNADNLEFLDVKGQIRDIEIIQDINRKIIVFAINNGNAAMYEKLD
ncbi:MAG: CRTAC1 family protein [Bacteroidia bacterium]|nr:CRTAC1 family protein [Bacteroidia bacterium]